MFHKVHVHADSTSFPAVLPLAHCAVNIPLNIIPNVFYWVRSGKCCSVFFFWKLKSNQNQHGGAVTSYVTWPNIQLNKYTHKNTISFPVAPPPLSDQATYCHYSVIRCSAAAHLLQGSMSGAMWRCPSAHQCCAAVPCAFLRPT